MSFGYGANLASSLAETVEAAIIDGCLCIQTSIAGKGPFAAADILATRELLADSNFRLYSHTCLYLNPAAPMPAALNTVVSLRDELRTVNAVGASCVLHIGGEKTGLTYEGKLENVFTTLQALPLTKRETGQRWPLLLENAAGEGRKLGSTLAELEFLGRGLAEKDIAAGFCIDTAHAFGAGIFDFGSVEAIDEMFEQLDEVLGKDRFQLLHLNDSKIKFGGCADRHENLGQGYIWQADLEPCAYLLRECKSRGIDVVLETPAAGHMKDYQWGCKARNA
jgi:deoxyribonuclease-4